MARRITAADVCTVTGYSRDELQATLRVLWPYSEEPTAPRVAREFAPRDLILLSVTQVLERRLGLRRSALGHIGKPLRAALSGPKEQSHKARLVVTVDPPAAEYVSLSITEREGLVVALGPIFDKVDSFVSFGGQGVLPLVVDVIPEGAKRRK